MAGILGSAAALGVILIALCAFSLFVVNRIAGARVGGLFGKRRTSGHLGDFLNNRRDNLLEQDECESLGACAA